MNNSLSLSPDPNLSHLSRRQFLSSTAAIAAGSTLAGTSALFNLACNSTTALSDVEKFEPVVLNALALACTIDTGLPVCGTMQGTIANDYQTLIRLWSDWNAAVKAGTSTSALWNDLNAAFTVFEQDSSLIFAAATGLNVPELTAIVTAAEVLLAAIEALFPDAPAAPASPAGTQIVRPKTPPKSAVFARYGINQPASAYNREWFRAWAADYNLKLAVARHMHPQVKLRPVRAPFHPF